MRVFTYSSLDMPPRVGKSTSLLILGASFFLLIGCGPPDDDPPPLPREALAPGGTYLPEVLGAACSSLGLAGCGGGSD